MPPRTNPLLILLIKALTATVVLLAGGAPTLPHQHHHGGGCLPAERAALLSFKKGITSDRTNLLSSWGGQDCCRWRGVTCNNRTGHVLKLQLGSHGIYGLTGEISPSLLTLEHLEHMDLSNNDFTALSSRVPLFLTSMRNLRHLDLSGISFTGIIPPQFGNLTKLQYFAAAREGALLSTDMAWLTNLSSLRHLDMSYANLSGIVDWPNKLNMIPSLRHIYLSSCSLDSTNQPLPYFNLSKLEKHGLEENTFEHTIASSWFWKARSLKFLRPSPAATSNSRTL